jgi:putative endonuclease
MYYIYFLKRLKNGKIYVGYTSKNPNDRLEEHNQGCNNWSKNNSPLVLIYFEKYHCKIDAMEREKFYKSGFGKKIKKVIIDTLDK